MEVEARDVRRRFGAVQALAGVSLALPGKGRVALIGPNGSGKSTLTRAIVGMLACEGVLRVGGFDPFRQQAELMRRVAYVPQVAPALACTVGEVVTAVCALRGVAAEWVRVCAEQLALPLPALAERPVRALSGGMRQKLLLALALAQEADLLVLDEPTASLDAASRQRFFLLLAERRPVPTVVLCSHRLEEIRHIVDRVVALEDGRVVYDGSAAEFLSGASAGVIEVRVAGDVAADWLGTQGFQRVPSGWWCREVRNGQRAVLLRELATSVGNALTDVVVREPDHAVAPRREENGS